MADFVVNYGEIPSNLYYFGKNMRDYPNFMTSVRIDPNYYRIWTGYDKSKEALEGSIPSLYAMTGYDTSDSLTEYSINDALRRSVYISPFVDFMNGVKEDEVESRYVKANHTLETVEYKKKEGLPIFSSDVCKNREDEMEVAQKSNEKWNLYCLHHAIYEAGEMQVNKYGVNTVKAPIVVNVYPKKMEDMVKAITEKVYGKENVSTTIGKDMDYAAVLDKFGRSQVMVFVDMDRLVVPTASQLDRFESIAAYKAYIMKGIDPSLAKASFENHVHEVEASGKYDFFDMGYGIRAIMGAIESVRENKISSFDETVSFHPISSIIERYPMLVDIAKNEELFYSKLDEIAVMAKTLQSEYDFVNVKRLGSPSDSFLKAYNTDLFLTSSSEEILSRTLTDEEKGIVLPKAETKVNIPPIEDSVNADYDELKSKYLGYLLAYTANVSGKYAKGSDDILDLINRSKEDSYISSLNISMLKSLNLDFSKEAGGKYAHQAQFLKYLLDKSDSYDFDVDSVFAQMLNGVDISSYDEGALKTIKAQIITEIEHYQDAVRDKDYAGDINFEGNKLVGDLMAMQSIAGNAEVMKRSTSFSPDNFDIPSEYYDYSPLNNVVDNMMIGGFNTSDYMYSQITDLFQRNPEAIRTFPLEAKEKSSFCKLLMEKKKKMPDNSKIQEYLSDVSQKMGVSESDVLGYYDMYYSKERKKGDYSKQMIQYLMQTRMNEMNMNNNANLEDSGPVM